MTIYDHNWTIYDHIWPHIFLKMEKEILIHSIKSWTILPSIKRDHRRSLQLVFLWWEMTHLATYLNFDDSDANSCNWLETYILVIVRHLQSKRVFQDTRIFLSSALVRLESVPPYFVINVAFCNNCRIM